MDVGVPSFRPRPRGGERARSARPKTHSKTEEVQARIAGKNREEGQESQEQTKGTKVPTSRAERHNKIKEWEAKRAKKERRRQEQEQQQLAEQRQEVDKKYRGFDNQIRQSNYYEYDREQVKEGGMEMLKHVEGKKINTVMEWIKNTRIHKQIRGHNVERTHISDPEKRKEVINTLADLLAGTLVTTTQKELVDKIIKHIDKITNTDDLYYRSHGNDDERVGGAFEVLHEALRLAKEKELQDVGKDAGKEPKIKKIITGEEIIAMARENEKRRKERRRKGESDNKEQ